MKKSDERHQILSYVADCHYHCVRSNVLQLVVQYSNLRFHQRLRDHCHDQHVILLQSIDFVFLPYCDLWSFLVLPVLLDHHLIRYLHSILNEERQNYVLYDFFSFLHTTFRWWITTIYIRIHRIRAIRFLTDFHCFHFLRSMHLLMIRSKLFCSWKKKEKTKLSIIEWVFWFNRTEWLFLLIIEAS